LSADVASKMPFAARRATLVALLLLAIPVDVAAQSLPPSVPLVAHGLAIVERQCARCHATGAADPSPFAAAPPFRDLRRRYPVEHLAEAFAEGLVTGHTAMPEVRLEADDIAAVLAYLKAVGRP
jgi:mono/diheme cytochrome c family protein